MEKKETTISGAAISSTLKQMSMIGDIGEEILKNFNIKKINLIKQYSFKIFEAIDKQFNVLKTLINDLNKQRFD